VSRPRSSFDPAKLDQWDQALYAFLAEKERRSGSRRTVESYSRMLTEAQVDAQGDEQSQNDYGRSAAIRASSPSTAWLSQLRSGGLAPLGLRLAAVMRHSMPHGYVGESLVHGVLTAGNQRRAGSALR